MPRRVVFDKVQSADLTLENGEEMRITVNGVPVFFKRSDVGPTQNIEAHIYTSGYACGSRFGIKHRDGRVDGQHTVVSFRPQDKTRCDGRA